MEENIVPDRQHAVHGSVLHCGLFIRHISMAMVAPCIDFETGSYLDSVFGNLLFNEKMLLLIYSFIKNTFKYFSYFSFKIILANYYTTLVLYVC